MNSHYSVDTLRNKSNLRAVDAPSYMKAASEVAQNLFGSAALAECIFNGNDTGSLYRAHVLDKRFGWYSPVGNPFHLVLI